MQITALLAFVLIYFVAKK